MQNNIKQSLTLLYTQFREIPKHHVNDIFLKNLSNSALSETYYKKNGLALFWMLANKLEFDRFCDAILDSEIPPIKLSKSEMEIIKGGTDWSGMCKNIKGQFQVHSYENSEHAISSFLNII